MSTVFQAVPTKKPARVQTLRNARMGTRAVPTVSKYSDALQTFTSLQRLTEAFESEKANVPFFAALAAAWQKRKTSEYSTP